MKQLDYLHIVNVIIITGKPLKDKYGVPIFPILFSKYPLARSE